MLLGSNKRNFGHALHGKPYFLFPDVLKRWFFQNKSRWNMIFVVLSRKMIFLFPKNMILHVRRKMKDDLSQKKYTEIWYFLQTFWKDGLFKKGRAGTWSFLYYLERQYFFSRKHDIFSVGGKWGWPFWRNTWKYDIFCVHVRVLETWRHAPQSKKNQRWSYPAKIHLKMINVLDWHSRKSSNNSLYFYGDLYRRFNVLLSSEKSQQT